MSFNLGAFPLNSVMVKEYSTLFDAGKTVMVTLMPTLIMGRAISGLINSKASSEFFDIIKDAILATVLMACFMGFINIVIHLPEEISTLFSNSGTYSLNLADEEHPLFNDIVNYATIICFWVSAAIYSGILIFVCAAAAYVIALGSMMQAKWLIKAMFWGIILMSSWPFLWYVCNSAIRLLAQQDGFINKIIVLVFNILKAASPLFATVLGLKHPIAAGAKATVGGAAKLAGGAAGIVASGTSKGISKLGGQPMLDNLNQKKESLSQSVNSNLAKTIPTMGLAAGTLGSVASKGFKKFAPAPIKSGQEKIAKGVSKVSGAFKNKTDLYTGKEIPNSAPILRAPISASQKAIASATSSVSKVLPMPKQNNKPSGTLDSVLSRIPNPSSGNLSENLEALHGPTGVSRPDLSAYLIPNTKLASSRNSIPASSYKPIYASRKNTKNYDAATGVPISDPSSLFKGVT